MPAKERWINLYEVDNPHNYALYGKIYADEHTYASQEEALAGRSKIMRKYYAAIQVIAEEEE